MQESSLPCDQNAHPAGTTYDPQLLHPLADLTLLIDAPICQDKRLGCLRDVSAHAEVCHNTLVDFTGEEAFEAADDLASGPAASRPAGDVVDRRLVEPPADDDRAMEGGVGLSVPAPIETMPAGRHPGRSRDRTGPCTYGKPHTHGSRDRSRGRGAGERWQREHRGRALRERRRVAGVLRTFLRPPRGVHGLPAATVHGGRQAA